MRRWRRALVVGLGLALAAGAAVAAEPSALFQQANEAARSGDYPRAIALYDDAAAAGGASASLFWNRAQASRARGAAGEALWALLQAREQEPGDAAVERALEEVRTELNLDRAELQPDPRALAARIASRLGLGWWAVALAAASLLAHALARFSRSPRAPTVALVTAALALPAALIPALGAFARPLAVVVRRGAPLLPAASPTVEATGSLREGEVVPILDASAGYFRIEDSSGARGWALAEDVKPLSRY